MVRSASVFGFSGIGCSTGSDALFCFLLIYSSPMGSLDFNESLGTRGSVQLDSFYVWSTISPSSRYREVVQLVNSTHNCATDLGSGFTFDCHESKHVQFSQFQSNSPRSTLVIYLTPITTDVFLCLSFLNNSLNSTGSPWPGLVCCYCTCKFRDCIFIANNINCLVATYSGATALQTVTASC
jgi:hypothetical protein